MKRKVLSLDFFLIFMITDAEVIYQNQYFTFESDVKINKEEDKKNIDNNFVPHPSQR